MASAVQSTKLQAALKQLINKAASGDARAIREVFKLQAMIAENDKSTDEKAVVIFPVGRPTRVKRPLKTGDGRVPVTVTTRFANPDAKPKVHF